jgi:hypothetical protein
MRNLLRKISPRAWDRATMLAAAALFVGALNFVAVGQGFQWVYPFNGVQPQASIDFSNPPITMGPQGYTAAVAGSGPSVVPIGSVAYASFGNATTFGASGTTQVASLHVPFNLTVTNINCLQGGTVGTNSVIGILYNTAGTKIANSATAGIATVGANTFLVLPLTAPLAIQGPGRYFVGLMPNGSTDNFRGVAASTFVNVLSAQVAAGVFGTLPNITPPTTFSANNGPICFLN